MKNQCGATQHFKNKGRDPQNPKAFFNIKPTEQKGCKTAEQTRWYHVAQIEVLTS